MGISLQQYRAKIGGFSQPLPKDKFQPAAILADSSWTFRLLIVILTLLMISGIEPNPGPNPPKRGTTSGSQVRTSSRQMKLSQSDWKEDFDALVSRIEKLEKQNVKLQKRVSFLEKQSREKRWATDYRTR